MPDSPTAAEETSSVSVGADVNANSSTAVTETKLEGSENKSTLDLVKEALTGPEKSPDSVTQDTTADSQANSAGEPEVPPSEMPEKEFKALSKEGQRRFRELSTGNRALNQKVKELEPKAQDFDRISSLMQRNSLSSEDVNSGFEIMALIKTQPEKALARLGPIVQALLKASGHELPEDLKVDVQSGAMSEERARELSQSRSRAARLADDNQRAEEKRAADATQRQQQETVNTAISTADAWHKEKAGSDPDWHLKQDRVVELVKLHVLETRQWPATEKEARALFDKTLSKVETELKRFVTRKPEIKHALGNASPRSTAAPKNTLEALKNAMVG